MITGGTWDRSIRPRYFLAGCLGHVVRGAQLGPFLVDALLAVNEIEGDIAEAKVDALIEGGGALLLDSGCFNLANTYAQAHGIDVIEAIAMPPADLDGFDALLAHYIACINRWGDRAWGYVEIDIGGRDNKIRTRAHLEGLGLNPIPVYHPFADGWDYFDELASQYDRICLANLGTAPPSTRKRLVATAFERARQYPDLWIHALGLSPSPLMLAFPMGSCDSSAWHASERWGSLLTWAATQKLWPVGRGWRCAPGLPHDDPRGTDAAYRLLGYDSGMQARAMRTILAERDDILGRPR